MGTVKCPLGEESVCGRYAKDFRGSVYCGSKICTLSEA
jgi:hypothetical protein